MDRGAWWGTAHGVQHKRVGHDLAAEHEARNHLYRTVLWVFVYLWPISFFFFFHPCPSQHMFMTFAMIDPTTEASGCMSSLIMGWCPLFWSPKRLPAHVQTWKFSLTSRVVILSLFFFPFIFISWRLITLQYCGGFCHTYIHTYIHFVIHWISHGFTSIPHPNPPSHLPLHQIPLGLPSAWNWSPLYRVK